MVVCYVSALAVLYYYMFSSKTNKVIAFYGFSRLGCVLCTTPLLVASRPTSLVLVASSSVALATTLASIKYSSTVPPVVQVAGTTTR